VARPGALALVAFGALGLASALPASACSVVPGYKVPTSLELATAAETIVLATVERERKGENPWSGAVLARPTLLLKGQALPPTVEIMGSALDDAKRRATSSDPRALRAPNPDALMGACVRFTFTRGMQLVLFLKRDKEGRLVPYRSPFARDAEDVAGPDSLWVKAVREYAAISEAPEAERNARLKKRIAELRARAGDPDAAALAADMEIELSGGRRPA
jgi:hypothetical protein